MVTNNDIEKRLWAAADQLWANSNLKPSEFSTPALDLIFLRYADRKFLRAGMPSGDSMLQRIDLVLRTT